ncbi:hypothetical protein WKV44_06850 [Spirochaetia bacterium 38H-sp]|uniref:Bacterial surface antigen (D15) domain-containing protein n=1 Tax=Rarispira pelagica TaxID=3141764 RepID=A0ABU9UDN8_9SPIR
MRKNIFLLIVCLAILLTANIFAQEEKNGTSGFFVTPELSVWGLGAIAGYRFSGFLSDNMDTIPYVGVKGGYFYDNYYRLPDGSVFSHPTAGYNAEDSSYSYWLLSWQSGLIQSFLSEGKHDYIGLDLSYKGELRNNINDAKKNELLFSSDIPEKNASLSSFLKASFFINYRLPHPVHQYVQGAYAEVWYLTMPDTMGSAPGGSLSYSAFGADTSYAFTAFDSDTGKNEFCIVVAVHAGGEYVYGDAIPFYSKGYAWEYIRGADGHGLDTLASLAANAEVRFYFPSPGIIANLAIWPVLYIFSDNGYFWDDAPSDGTQVSTAGAGFALEFAPVLVLSMSTQWRLTDTNIDGTKWVPIKISLGSYLF